MTLVFRRNQCAGFGGGLDDGVGVDGLDGVDVEHAGGYAFLSQRFGGLQSVGDADAGSVRVTSEPSRRRSALPRSNS